MAVIKFPSAGDPDFVKALGRLVEAARAGEVVSLVGLLSFADGEQGMVYAGEVCDNIPGAIGQCWLLAQRLSECVSEPEEV